MAWLHIHHKVQDYNNWRQAWERTAEYKRHQGWKRFRLFQVAGERTNLIVMEQFDTLEQARAYATSDVLQNSLELAGVIAPAEILILDGLEEGPA